MRKILIVGIILLIGIGILVYPMVSDYLARKNGSYVIDGYEAVISKEDKERLDELWKRAVLYNENLWSAVPVMDPFLPNSEISLSENYMELLNINGTMGHIEIPKISVNIPIYHGTHEEVLKKGIGHLEGSTLPVGGPGTHCVLTGHTGLVNAQQFTDLELMEKGDLFFLYILDRVLAYEVDQVIVTEPDDIDALLREKGKDYCTLLTCTPYGINSHRLMVRGIRVDVDPNVKDAIVPAKKMTEGDKGVIIAAIITSGIMMITIIIVVIHRRKLQQSEGMPSQEKNAASEDRIDDN